MSLAFEPSVLQDLGLDAALQAKNITTDTNPTGFQYLLRPLKSTDYDYLHLLKQLTVVGDISKEEFECRFKEFTSRPNTYFIVVLEDLPLRKLIGCATLLVELKMIHNRSKRGHIEDVVIDEAYRSKGLGKLLVSVLIEVGRSQGCYKISLDCNSDKVAFYERNGFKQETISISAEIRMYNSLMNWKFVKSGGERYVSSPIIIACPYD
ncbi:putative glucosamine 6-phosphate N-acetyltransferase [Echinococcus granulosus]|uniref:Glucosamine 6-phosphate N-acetyltransferase n=1 Tax=Echinococcus granulosus TaxID=6210 RepID=W6V020_ECHGR|nr:putative glucosamine 6-phosphate N-acetyltransferase [Echinococcus granulosus]EUB59304.1 putative glucosamine 6-phosphate N-acetyltransferase [Echinococcus granulosus]